MRRLGIVIFTVFLLLSLGGCRADSQTESQRTKLDFTVVPEEEIPKELLAKIEEKETGEFRMAYESSGYLFIARGYGQQETGGYSITVRECSEDENTVYLDTVLIGPSHDKPIRKEPSCPRIVVKVEARDKQVQFLGK